MTMYRLTLRGPTGRIANVHRFSANTDEGAIAKARERMADDLMLIRFELWKGKRQVAEAGVHRPGPSRRGH